MTNREGKKDNNGPVENVRKGLEQDSGIESWGELGWVPALLGSLGGDDTCT